MQSYKKLINNSFIFAIGTIGSRLVSFLLVPLYAYYLTSESYGTVDLIITTVSMIIPVITLSIYEAILRFAVDKKIDNKALFSNSLSIVLGGYLISVLFYPVLYNFNVFGDYLIFFYIILLLQSLQMILQQFARGIGAVRKFVINGILVTLLTGIFNIVFLVGLDFGVYGYLAATILALFLSILYLFLVLKLGNYMSFKSIELNKVKELLIYSLPMVPNSIAYRLTNSSSRYFILYFLGAGANGLFAVASKLPLVINIVNQVFTQAWQLSAFEEYEKDNISDFYSTVFSYLSIVLFMATAGILTFTKPLFSMFFTTEYFAAWQPVPFLMIGVVFSSFSGFFGTNYTASKETGGVFRTSIYGGISTLILNLILIPTFGLIGAGLSSTFSFFIVFIIRYFDTKKYIKIIVDWKKTWVNLLIILAQTVIMFLGFSLITETILLIVLFLFMLVYNRSFFKLLKKIVLDYSQEIKNKFRK